LQGSAGTLVGAANAIESVIDNLVGNALQHGGPDVHVIVRAWSEPGAAGFEVVDDGPGIVDVARIFDRFYTTDRNRGIGLGLATVRLVCRAHGGDVSVRSRPGRTVFSVALPSTSIDG
jgi:signal transduction histidine kinase